MDKGFRMQEELAEEEGQRRWEFYLQEVILETVGNRENGNY